MNAMHKPLAQPLAMASELKSHTQQTMVDFAKPIDMVLFCPFCGTQHIDQPDDAHGWNNPPHRSHLCATCGHIWRPADVPTNGVLRVSRGKSDSPIITPMQRFTDLVNANSREVEARRAAERTLFRLRGGIRALRDAFAEQKS